MTDFYKSAYYFFKHRVVPYYPQKVTEDAIELWAQDCASHKMTLEQLTTAFQKYRQEDPNGTFVPTALHLIRIIYPLSQEAQTESAEVAELKMKSKNIVQMFQDEISLDGLRDLLETEYGPIFNKLDFEKARYLAHRSNADRDDLAKTFFRILAKNKKQEA